ERVAPGRGRDRTDRVVLKQRATQLGEWIESPRDRSAEAGLGPARSAAGRRGVTRGAGGFVEHRAQPFTLDRFHVLEFRLAVSETCQFGCVEPAEGPAERGRAGEFG